MAETFKRTEIFEKRSAEANGMTIGGIVMNGFWDQGITVGDQPGNDVPAQIVFDAKNFSDGDYKVDMGKILDSQFYSEFLLKQQKGGERPARVETKLDGLAGTVVATVIPEKLNHKETVFDKSYPDG